MSIVLATCSSAAQTSTATYGYETISANWAGYAATASDSGTPLSFVSASATWRQPKVTCAAGDAGAAAATWVGIGGLSGSQALDQIGTSAECDDLAQPTYFAWFEVLPGPGKKLELAVEPGDKIAASVTVKAGGTEVRVALANLTRGTGVARSLPVLTAGTATAEWIVETPIRCDNVACRPAPLADFGTVSFNDVSMTGDGHAGTLADSLWTAVPIRHAARPLTPGASGGESGEAGAMPSPLRDGGASFAVDWTAGALPRVELRG